MAFKIHLCFISFIIFVNVATSYKKSVCENVKGIQWKSDSANCSILYLCFNDRTFEYTCPENFVADEEGKSCVPKGSEFDKCTRRSLNVGLCEIGSDLRIPDKESCARFFACPQDIRGHNSELEEQECPYPLLYDEEIKRCGHPDTVKCGSRFEPKDACDYKSNQCTRSAHCIPCHVRHPSCKGLPDGLNPWIGREESPFYTVCSNERVVYKGKCSQDDNTQIFSKTRRMCVELRK